MYWLRFLPYLSLGVATVLCFLGAEVFILEVPTSSHPVIKSYHDQYRLLVSCLIAYASLIKDAAC